MNKQTDKLLKEDVSEYFGADQVSKRVFDLISKNLTDQQIAQIDWELLIPALGTVGKSPAPNRHGFSEEAEEATDNLLRGLDETLLNLGF